MPGFIFIVLHSEEFCTFARSENVGVTGGGSPSALLDGLRTASVSAAAVHVAEAACSRLLAAVPSAAAWSSPSPGVAAAAGSLRVSLPTLDGSLLDRRSLDTLSNRAGTVCTSFSHQVGYAVGIPPCFWGSEAEGLAPPPKLSLNTRLRSVKYCNATYYHYGSVPRTPPRCHVCAPPPPSDPIRSLL